TGQVASNVVDTGRGYIHDCKGQFGMLESISKQAYRVRRAEQAPSIFRDAITNAFAAPSGPVSVEIPIDFQAALINPPVVQTTTVKGSVPSDSELASAVERISAAKRPIIWAGGGAMLSDASPEVSEL